MSAVADFTRITDSDESNLVSQPYLQLADHAVRGCQPCVQDVAARVARKGQAIRASVFSGFISVCEVAHISALDRRRARMAVERLLAGDLMGDRGLLRKHVTARQVDAL